jgi:glycine/D-amino acid oxidase-like deaminating enzyme
MRVVICGGGVIGASIAYFLSRRGAEAIVVERTAVAAAASGKSGGFLALDWCDGSPLEALARRSFALHARLPDEIGGDWGYRRLTTVGGLATGGRRDRNRLSEVRRLGSIETTAQVHPGAFTAAMMRAAEDRGAKLRYGRVTGVVRTRGDAFLKGVEVDQETIEADAVVIAMGPWSILAAAWLPFPEVFGLKGHSIVFETGVKVPPQAVFLDYAEAPGKEFITLEVFPRADGTTYVCAISSMAPLPANPAAVKPEPGAIERLEAVCRRLFHTVREAPILARQACFRPVTQDGLPLIGRIADVDNAYVATGHSVWGILNAPATGEAMAELILDRTTKSVDLASFRPDRLRPFSSAAIA